MKPKVIRTVMGRHIRNTLQICKLTIITHLLSSDNSDIMVVITISHHGDRFDNKIVDDIN